MAIVVEKDEYLLVLSAHIHLNPVRAGIVKNPKEYIWSSYGSYIGKNRSPSFLFISEILAKFRNRSAYGQYVVGFLADEKGIGPEDVYGRNSFLGSDGFIRQALSGFRGEKRNAKNGGQGGEGFKKNGFAGVSIDELFYPGAGHTVDNIVTWIADEQVLCGGCLVKAGAARTLAFTSESDLDSWPASQQALNARYPAARLIVPGHSDPGGWELVENTLKLTEENSK